MWYSTLDPFLRMLSNASADEAGSDTVSLATQPSNLDTVRLPPLKSALSASVTVTAESKIAAAVCRLFSEKLTASRSPITGWSFTGSTLIVTVAVAEV